MPPAKFIREATVNLLIDDLVSGDRIFICTTDLPAEPSYAACSTGNNLATHVIDGDLARTNPGGVAKLTVAQITGITVDTTGTAGAVVIAKTSGSLVLHVTTITSVALVAGNSVTINTYTHDINAIA